MVQVGSPLQRHRALYTLHELMKELSSRRLRGHAEAMRRLSAQLLQPIFNFGVECLQTVFAAIAPQ